ncbi:MAG: hypothetical protein ACT4PW_12490 [Acidimicrobiia bacterium]
MRRRLRHMAGPMVAVALLAACGDDSSADGASSSAPVADVTVRARDTLRFDRDTYSADAGSDGAVSFDYVGDGTLTHTLLIEGVDGFRLEVTGRGDSDRGRAALASVVYTLYCDVPGHSTMKAKLTVG